MGESGFGNRQLQKFLMRGLWGCERALVRAWLFCGCLLPIDLRSLRAADEVGVGGEAAEGGEELFDLGVGGHLDEAAAEGGDGFEFVVGDEEVFFAGA